MHACMHVCMYTTFYLEGSHLLNVGNDLEAELRGLVKVMDEHWHQGHDVEGEPRVLGVVKHGTCREQGDPAQGEWVGHTI